jgi:hypothetical protein
MRWKVRFADEPGLDYGGITREFFEKLGRGLFSPETGLFVSFDEVGVSLSLPPSLRMVSVCVLPVCLG